MKVLAHVHIAPPTHNAGSEVMMQTMLRYLVERGHEAKILVQRGPSGEHHNIETVSVEGLQGQHGTPIKRKLHRWADVVVTHLDMTRDAVKLTRNTGRPLVHLVHNHWQLEHNKITTKISDLAVMNSEWLAAAVNWPGRQIIVRPPIRTADYRTTPGEHVTMINLTLTKGCDTFYACARAMPDRPHLGVVGAYGVQQIHQLPNVEIQQHTANMAAEVYGRTRILLVPSNYESWGRVAVEAMVCGIPVIAHPTDGLRESLGDAGIFLDRDDHDAWVAEIERLDDPDAYRSASDASLARAAELDRIATEDLARWEQALLELVG